MPALHTTPPGRIIEAAQPRSPEAIMSRRSMSGRISIVLLFMLLLSVLQLQAKNKKKQLLPEDVLRAQTVMVVIHPDAGEALTAPLANRNAQDEVERAITKWGRFDLVMDAY